MIKRLNQEIRGLHKQIEKMSRNPDCGSKAESIQKGIMESIKRYEFATLRNINLKVANAIQMQKSNFRRSFA